MHHSSDSVLGIYPGLTLEFIGSAKFHHPQLVSTYLLVVPRGSSSWHDLELTLEFMGSGKVHPIYLGTILRESSWHDHPGVHLGLKKKSPKKDISISLKKL
jgi:hypothetical protein